MIDFLESKFIKSCNVNVAQGSFALDKQPLIFEHCRERFAVTFEQDIQGFYFKHQNGKSLDVAQFIQKTEVILGQEIFSQFAKTNRDSILWVEPAFFWKSCALKRSLFTILLRAGRAYNCNEDNYEQALFAQEYVVSTRKAVIRFIFGFTNYIGPNMMPNSSGTAITCGWRHLFQNKSESEIKKLLVSPHKISYDHGDLFSNSLWI